MYPNYKVVNRKLFSEKETTDLIKAWVAISLAFAIVIRGFSFGPEFLYAFLLSALTVGIGFLAHELAHRTVARHYGCHAEFRAFDSMLILAVVMSFLGFVFAAPGAVMISGPVGVNRNGKISAAGPGVNLVLALIFLVLILVLEPAGFLRSVSSYGFLINSWLALFNMLPFGNFDGKKILNWNRTVYGIMVGVGLVFLFLQGSLI